ncbi:MAG: 50S ribosomal protein L29 [Parachlamydiaceae bacterium]|nr:50S ribosomal protein L29 [Parachlamydiaceae bacterium]
MTKEAVQFRDLSVDELEARRLDERKTLFNLVNERAQAGRRHEKPHRIRQTKKTIARLLTIQREKQIAKG